MTTERQDNYDSRYACGRCGHYSALEHLRGECFECKPGDPCAYLVGAP